MPNRIQEQGDLFNDLFNTSIDLEKVIANGKCLIPLNNQGFIIAYCKMKG